MLNTGTITRAFRQLGLMHALDWLRYAYFFVKNYGKNQRFKQANPGIALPPNYVLFEAFNLDFEKYFNGGRETASWVKEKLAPHLPLADVRILDWGCGPARLVRHFPEVFGPQARVFATDYNPKTIAWCRANIPNVEFHQNEVDPPTDFASAVFDAIVGISIFTHLAAANHLAWFAELYRLLDSNGVLFITTHGEAFKAKLTDSEIEQFERNELIVRGKAKEGHRVFTAFHPPIFLRRLFENQFEVLAHTPGQVVSWGIEQDLWILRKK